ncbi:MAG: N-acyl homoserine lactonase family protein [Pseudomonadota bacterium]
MSTPTETYRVFAIRYAHYDRRSGANFLGGDPHDVPKPLDFFVWAIVSDTRAFLVDTGFDEKVGARRGRSIIRPVEEGLKAVGIDTNAVEDVILTHMHYDHAGNNDLFPRARYHVQDREMAYCTGRCMCHPAIGRHFEPDDVASMVQKTFAGRVQFHDRNSCITPGLSLHHVGGHTQGMQVVRVHTRQGWMVLASDASHFYANMEQRRPYPGVDNVAEMIEGFSRLYSLADAPQFVIPGHDPDVLKRFAAASADQEGWIARLDTAPR